MSLYLTERQELQLKYIYSHLSSITNSELKATIESDRIVDHLSGSTPGEFTAIEMILSYVRGLECKIEQLRNEINSAKIVTGNCQADIKTLGSAMTQVYNTVYYNEDFNHVVHLTNINSLINRY